MSKTESNSLHKISASFLKQHGYFRNWLSGTITWTSGYSKRVNSVSIQVSTWDVEKYIRIYYTQTAPDTGKKRDFDYRIPLTTTPCRYGGVRYWFKCPWYKDGIYYCGRCVGTLYQAGDYFACRHCYNLTYESRNINRRHVSRFPLFDVFPIEDKIAELEKKIKRPYYRGKPTKKQRKVDRLNDQLSASYKKMGFL